MSARPGRRALLTSGTGLVIGAGAAIALPTVPDEPANADVDLTHVPSPGEELMTEHGVLKRVLLAYRAVLDRLGRGAAVPRGAVLDAAQIVADYVESFHEGLEEAYVFPRVAAHASYAGIVDTLLEQHDRGRHLTADVLLLAGDDLTDGDVRAALRVRLDAFVSMYEPHEAWEDTVVYPALRRLTPQRTLAELAERFADLEATRYSDLALQRILGRVEGVEEQLELGDLAAFTPSVAQLSPLPQRHGGRA